MAKLHIKVNEHDDRCQTISCVTVSHAAKRCEAGTLAITQLIIPVS